MRTVHVQMCGLAPCCLERAGQHFMPPSQLDAQLADLELDAAPPPPTQQPLQRASAMGTDTQACHHTEWRPARL
jgi:gluconate kinase